MEFESFSLQALATTYVVPLAINLLVAGIIVYAGLIVARLARSTTVKVLAKRKDSDPMLNSFLSSIVFGLIVTVVCIAALGRLGVQTASLVAVVGAAGLAIGLALQGSLQNFAAGVMLLLFKPFRQGHFVDAGGAMGVVEQIGLFSTTMRTADNREIIVPNGNIFGSTITNFSARDTRRVDMTFGIGYDDDIQLAKQILNDIVATDPRILRDPAPQVAVSELADSSINFVVRPWVAAADYWDVLFDMNERVKAGFDQAGISIPYPQMDLHLPPGAKSLATDTQKAQAEA